MFWLTRVRSHSMAPTLADGRLALTRSLRRTATPRRGDVVVADSAELGERVVKRVIGLPGETVIFAGGAVAIDGQRLIEPYAAPSTYRGEFRVPAGHYLLLGDNRDRSNDSRSWRQPFLPRSAIRGLIVSRPTARRTNARMSLHGTSAGPTRVSPPAIVANVRSAGRPSAGRVSKPPRGARSSSPLEEYPDRSRS